MQKEFKKMDENERKAAIAPLDLHFHLELRLKLDISQKVLLVQLVPGTFP